MTSAEIAERLRYRADARGECDRCHAPESRDLYTDQTEPGEFALCGRCWRQIARNRAERERQRARYGMAGA